MIQWLLRRKSFEARRLGPSASPTGPHLQGPLPEDPRRISSRHLRVNIFLEPAGTAHATAEGMGKRRTDEELQRARRGSPEAATRYAPTRLCEQDYGRVRQWAEAEGLTVAAALRELVRRGLDRPTAP